MRRFRALVVGLGLISTEWLTALGAREDVEVAGLVDADEERAQAQRTSFGLRCPVGRDLEHALDAWDVDLVVNLTPPATHRQVCEIALRRGCDVIVEKPMTSELADAVALLAVVRSTGRTLAVMQNRRFHPAIRQLREWVTTGAIGELVDVSVDMFLWHRHPNTFLTEIESPLLRDMAIHQFDAARAITGVEPVAVQSTEWSSPTAWMRGAAAATATFELAAGQVFSYRGSWVAEGASTSYDGRWRVSGTHGTATWDGEQRLALEIVERPDGPFQEGTTAREELPLAGTGRPTGHAVGLAAILDALHRGERPETSAQDNVVSLAMVEAAIQAARLRRRVTLAEVFEAAGGEPSRASNGP